MWVKNKLNCAPKLATTLKLIFLNSLGPCDPEACFKEKLQEQSWYCIATPNTSHSAL